MCIRDRDNKLVKVEGDPLNAVANGKLCMRCLSMPEAVNHPDRLKYPCLLYTSSVDPLSP